MLSAAEVNLAQLRETRGSHVLHLWDAQRLPVRSAGLDTVVTNLPFGEQIGTHVGNQALYAGVFRELARTLRPGLRISRRTAQVLFEAEVQLGLGTGAVPSASCHLLRHYAADSVAHGLDPAYALRAVTLTNAELLGVADRLGSITAGKEANLVVFDGPPIETKSTVLLTVVGGKIVYEKKEKTSEKKEKPSEEKKK